MNKILFTSLCMFFLCIYPQAQSQTESPVKDTIRVVFENEKMKVTEYISNPGKDVCGIGKHSHAAHLDIAITDITTTVTGEDGKVQNFELRAGSTFWNKAVTHVAINNGNKPAKLIIVEPK
jgi:hypothetical protein